MYDERGINQTFLKAYTWLSLVAMKGDVDAATDSRALAAAMTRDEIQEATSLVEAQRRAEIPRIAEAEERAQAELLAESQRAEREEAARIANRRRSSWAGQRCLGYGYAIDDPRFPECIERETQVQALVNAQEAQGREIAEATEAAAETAARQNALRSLREMSKPSKSITCQGLTPTTTTCTEY